MLSSLEELFEEPQAAVPISVATAATPATRRITVRLAFVFIDISFLPVPLSSLKLNFEEVACCC